LSPLLLAKDLWTSISIVPLPYAWNGVVVDWLLFLVSRVNHWIPLLPTVVEFSTEVQPFLILDVEGCRKIPPNI
jgi:hypothetical protein